MILASRIIWASRASSSSILFITPLAAAPFLDLDASAACRSLSISESESLLLSSFACGGELSSLELEDSESDSPEPLPDALEGLPFWAKSVDGAFKMDLGLDFFNIDLGASSFDFDFFFLDDDLCLDLDLDLFFDLDFDFDLDRRLFFLWDFDTFEDLLARDRDLDLLERDFDLDLLGLELDLRVLDLERFDLFTLCGEPDLALDPLRSGEEDLLE